MLKVNGNGTGSFPTYLLDKAAYYDRDELYGTPQGDYPDNAERFIMFCRSALETLKAIDFRPDIIHCNDWQSALIPVYLKTMYSADPFFKNTASVFTIHNLAYQGSFDYPAMPLTGLDWKYFTPDWLEFYGRLNFLKGGILHADIINTVSKKYSQEIQTAKFGCGLDGVLQSRKTDLYGILNGVDYDLFDPDTDKQIAVNFDAEHLDKKKENKKALQREYNLPEEDVPLIGVVSRLADQKGFDLVAQTIESLLNLRVQLVLLGTGEAKYHTLFREIGKKYPKKAGINISYNGRLAQMIYAGSDMFLMPSNYEPCGLGQLISLKYGTIPIVHATGGLADTINDYLVNPASANGFVFTDYSANALFASVSTALLVYSYKDEWQKLVKRAMSADFSWKHSAKEYVNLYEEALLKHNMV